MYENRLRDRGDRELFGKIVVYIPYGAANDRGIFFMLKVVHHIHERIEHLCFHIS
jgi:hypothetical protein